VAETAVRDQARADFTADSINGQNLRRRRREPRIRHSLRETHIPDCLGRKALSEIDCPERPSCNAWSGSTRMDPRTGCILGVAIVFLLAGAFIKIDPAPAFAAGSLEPASHHLSVSFKGRLGIPPLLGGIPPLGLPTEARHSRSSPQFILVAPNSFFIFERRLGRPHHDRFHMRRSRSTGIHLRDGRTSIHRQFGVEHRSDFLNFHDVHELGLELRDGVSPW
jgi:hypothetical protein